MRLPLLLLLAACTGTDDKPADSGGDTDVETDSRPDDTGETADPHAPSAPEIVIAPAAPPAGAGFAVVLVTPSTDPDGDAVSYRYAWSENGAPRAELTGEAISGTGTVDGDVWAVTVTPTDGALDGSPASATVTIGNSAPSAFAVTFSPAAPIDGDDITLVLDPPPVDPDGDPLTTSVTWYEDASLNTVHTDKTTIEGRYVSGGEVYRAIVSVTDGYHAALVAEGTVTVANNPPVLDSVRITPVSAADDDDLVATASAEDPDGSEITYAYAWYRDDVEATDVGNVDTVPAAATQVNEIWHVVVTASDGTDSVSATSDGVTIIAFEGTVSSYTFSARIAPGGATGSGSWAYDVLSHGGRTGEAECSLAWEVDLTEPSRDCPSCDFSFDAAFTYDTAASTVTSGRACAALATDGDGTLTYTEARETFALSSYGSGYYSGYMSVRGTDTTTYTSSYSYYYSSYGVSQETDTAGYTTLTAFRISRRYYY
ncbi:MAG: hypothetical protein Q8P18_32375 [Pseudomonadota bacterium]|nr:hypothetical protein [Pseudomonadota bacterium]